MKSTIRSTAVAVMTFILGGLVAVTVSFATAPPAPAAPNVSKVAETSLNAWARGDYAGFRDTWAAYPTRLLGERDYLELTDRTCPPKPCPTRNGYHVNSVTLDGATASVVTTHTVLDRPRGFIGPVVWHDVRSTHTFINELGDWRYQPPTSAVRLMERIHAGELTIAEAAAELGAPSLERSCL